jgi:hypothetical protein
MIMGGFNQATAVIVYSYAIHMSRTNIQVVCRFRPFNSMEKSLDNNEYIAIEEDEKGCNLQIAASRHEFTFDRIYGMNIAQSAIFEHIGVPVVESKESS